MSAQSISFAQGEAGLDWLELTERLAQGHQAPPALIEDVFLRRGADTILNRSAWIDGLGMLVKVATVFPGNQAHGKAMVNGVVSLFSDADGSLTAMIDFHLLTKWKTAADSLLAARRLARPESKNILIVGAGNVGRSLFAAYSAAFPEAHFSIWNRSEAGAMAFAGDCPGVQIVEDLELGVSAADIITCATVSFEPLIKGAWLRPGQHLDLIGAYRADMREADDLALQRARIFVDSRQTVLDHIGELKTPLESGAIDTADVLADFYQLDRFAREDNDEITLFKNGGGAHLDLMTARYILDVWEQGRSAKK